MIKKSYKTPRLKVFGEVEVLTKALGGAAIADQSEYPAIHADHGSFDTIQNNDPSNPG